MADESVKYWFNGFEKGIMNLNKEEQEKFFCKCGQSCADGGVINLYKSIYDESKGDIDTFFEKLNKVDDVKTKIIESQKSYYLIFERCLCNISLEGYFTNPILCECSRQSIIYVLKTIFKNLNFKVEMCSTVLKGDTECKYEITII